MRLLLDTHALLWWFIDDPALTSTARKLIANPMNSVVISAASAWEIATKVRIGKLPSAANLATDFNGYLVRSRFESLAISADHAVRAGLLPGPLRDPFDRMLIAQAQSENLLLISNEAAFDAYGVRRSW